MLINADFVLMRFSTDSNEICSSFEKDLAVERFQISTKFFHQSAKMLHSILGKEKIAWKNNYATFVK